MSDRSRKSAGISPRRALLEEVLEERSRVVAALPIDRQDPGPRSPLWMLGAGRCAGRAQLGERQGALDLAVMALAWLEAFGLPADLGAGGEDDPVR